LPTEKVGASGEAWIREPVCNILLDGRENLLHIEGLVQLTRIVSRQVRADQPLTVPKEG
jgi:hypothetical protein